MTYNLLASVDRERCIEVGRRRLTWSSIEFQQEFRATRDVAEEENEGVVGLLLSGRGNVACDR